MPTLTLPGTDSPATTSYISPGGSFYIYSNVTVPQGRAMANGSRNIRTVSLSLYVAGRSGTVNIRPYFAGARGSYTGYGAQGTPTKKTMSVNVQTAGGGTFPYGIYWGGGGVNFRRGGGGSTESSGSSSWGSSLSGTLQWAQAPEAPTPIGVDSATSSSLRARFSANDNGGMTTTGWVLRYSKSSNMSGAKTVASSGTTTVTGLDPDTTYYFQAAGRNPVTDYEDTTGPWSTTFSGKTLSATPGPPKLSRTAIGATQTKLTWTAPNSGGSSITGYRVQYSKNSNFSGATNVDLGNVLTWTSPVLDTGNWYFRVLAKNANGNGTWSNVVTSNITRTGYPKVQLSGDFVGKPVKVYLSGNWAIKPMKVYQGGQWVTLL